MTGRRRLQFGMIAILGFILVVSVIVRVWAPRLEFERMISSRSSNTIREIVVKGQGRQVRCRSKHLVEYIGSGIMRSARGGRAYREDYDAGLPPRRYVPYTMRVRTSCGYYSFSCWISAKDCCMFIPFEDPIGEDGTPNRRFEFAEPIPGEAREMLQFLLSDLDMDNRLMEL
ncbi:hypothetical protein HOV93_52020 [Planctomycetes bacterium FF15]|uniref:Uncharacterized protein n=1 Tax=Bremerella alba TaxID=980252 RepID=A0A7V8VAJ0_9BACT|nr:hypothetical protein [Bremerella alba]